MHDALGLMLNVALISAHTTSNSLKPPESFYSVKWPQTESSFSSSNSSFTEQTTYNFIHERSTRMMPTKTSLFAYNEIKFIIS